MNKLLKPYFTLTPQNLMMFGKSLSKFGAASAFIGLFSDHTAFLWASFGIWCIGQIGEGIAVYFAKRNNNDSASTQS